MGMVDELRPLRHEELTRGIFQGESRKIAHITDFAGTRQGFNMNNNSDYFWSYWIEKEKPNDSFSYSLYNDSAEIVNREGRFESYQTYFSNGVRVCMPYKSEAALEEYFNVVSKGSKTCIEIGEYPQSRVKEKEQRLYDKKLKAGTLTPTKKKYAISTNTIKTNQNEISYLDEYIDSETNEKFVHCPLGDKKRRSWFKVEPLVWEVDRVNKLLVGVSIINANICYNAPLVLSGGTYENSALESFINNHLKKDILNYKLSNFNYVLSSREKQNKVSNPVPFIPTEEDWKKTLEKVEKQEDNETAPDKIEKKPIVQNNEDNKEPANVVVEQEKDSTASNVTEDNSTSNKIWVNQEKAIPSIEQDNINNNMYFGDVTEEDIIKGAIESGIPVFLHGRPGEGKSARIKELDPDCITLYLMGEDIESINGLSVYDEERDEMIDIAPEWYTRLVEKCNKDPDKLHILFFDELTNAMPTIQSAVFSIILDRRIDGKWTLPENARIAAAGNEVEDSMSAFELAEPLYDRFAHVNIETTVDNWLNWAMNNTKEVERLDNKKIEDNYINANVISYIESNNIVLRTEFTGITPNANPRKWEMVSKMINVTKAPKMIRSLVGDKICDHFTSYCKRKYR